MLRNRWSLEVAQRLRLILAISSFARSFSLQQPAYVNLPDG